MRLLGEKNCLRRSEIVERLTLENVAVQKDLKKGTVKTTSEREVAQRVNQEYAATDCVECEIERFADR